MPQNRLEENRVTVVAPLRLERASLSSVAEALQLPPEEERQPDLQYLTAIMVSSGMNKNGAVFLGSELVKAKGSIVHKAMDMEHEDRSVIGHITNKVYLMRDGTFFDAAEISKIKDIAQLDEMEMDIGISAIIHRARFPEVADEILDGQWMVSMEAFYRDYDVKVGELIIPREQAEELGYDELIGKVVKVKDGDKEIGFHLVGRVLRDIIFAGVGLVKNPANERSIILEAAAMKDFVESNKETASVVNIADIKTIDLLDKAKKTVEVPVVSQKAEEISDIVRQVISEELAKATGEVVKEISGLRYNDMRPGTCVSYKRWVYDYPEDALTDPPTDLTQDPLFTGPDGGLPIGAKVVGEHYCNLFDLDCSARPGDATRPTCWRNVFARTVREELTDREDILREFRKRDAGLVKLQDLIDEARKFRQ